MLSSSKACAVITASVIVFTSFFALPSQAADDKSEFYKTLSSINKDSKKNLVSNTATVAFSPSINKKQKQQFRATVDSSLSFWSKEANLGNVSILFWSPTDISWAKKKYAQLALGWNNDAEQLHNDIKVINGRPTCAGSSNDTRYSNPLTSVTELNHVTRICVNHTMTPWYWHVVAHELTHMWQYSAIKIETSPWLWIIEGGATYYGLALSGIDQTKAKENIKHMYSTYFLYDEYGRSLKKKIEKNSSALVKFLDSTLPPANYSGNTRSINMTNASYHIGSLVVAKMVEEYGHKKFVEFYNSLATSNDYKENFKSIYGIEFALFCEEIAKDIFNQVK